MLFNKLLQASSDESVFGKLLWVNIMDHILGNKELLKKSLNKKNYKTSDAKFIDIHMCVKFSSSKCDLYG